MENLQTQGISLPRLGLGTFRMQGDACRVAVESALALGYRHIDTAEMYDNEEAIGAAIQSSRVARKELHGPPSTSNVNRAANLFLFIRENWARNVMKGKANGARRESRHAAYSSYPPGRDRRGTAPWPKRRVPIANGPRALDLVDRRGQFRNVDRSR